MWDELHQAPDAVKASLERNAERIREVARLIAQRDPAFLVTCARGSSDHAAHYFKYLAEIELGLPCCSIGPSVISIYDAPLRFNNTIVFAVSQSGKGPDILAVVKKAREQGAPVVALTNDETSPLAEQADIVLPLHAGPELSVAATKTFITSAALLAAIVAQASNDTKMIEAVEDLPGELRRALTLDWSAADVLADAESLYILGRGPAWPIAQEAALKLKECSALHAEAYSLAEAMHGPKELVQAGFPALVLNLDDASSTSTSGFVADLRRAGATIIAPDYHRTGHSALDPISMIQSFYVVAEGIARLRGRDPDRPFHLQKVTTTR
jgi:glucosamine--fructose-6-phosphate aminotransferase (isomerizing)